MSHTFCCFPWIFVAIGRPGMQFSSFELLAIEATEATDPPVRSRRPKMARDLLSVRERKKELLLWMWAVVDRSSGWWVVGGLLVGWRLVFEKSGLQAREELDSCSFGGVGVYRRAQHGEGVRLKTAGGGVGEGAAPPPHAYRKG